MSSHKAILWNPTVAVRVEVVTAPAGKDLHRCRLDTDDDTFQQFVASFWIASMAQYWTYWASYSIDCRPETSVLVVYEL